jgi:hypothetical protein
MKLPGRRSAAELEIALQNYESVERRIAGVLADDDLDNDQKVDLLWNLLFEDDVKGKSVGVV